MHNSAHSSSRCVMPIPPRSYLSLVSRDQSSPFPSEMARPFLPFTGVKRSGQGQPCWIDASETGDLCLETKPTATTLVAWRSTDPEHRTIDGHGPPGLSFFLEVGRYLSDQLWHTVANQHRESQ